MYIPDQKFLLFLNFPFIFLIDTVNKAHCLFVFKFILNYNTNTTAFLPVG